jgi:glycosyltransferase involved in cell wall biosynthesis/cellulose synthase/poly-beta-1,6-N-acetylglucosamine synthase-like glycosyltransferase/O-antigen/teichoic acid export membrane protein
MSDRRLSVIIPTLNERGNIEPLVTRLAQALNGSGVTWEAIFIDDHSTDGTFQQLERMAQAGFPIYPYLKAGKRGKAYSLLEGFARAKYDAVAILDADLQYPPEALPAMAEKLATGHTDIVVANRLTRETTLLRRILSRSFKAVFSEFLHGLNCDVQSGLKVFRRKILHDVKLDPTPWTFDLEFLLAARNYGYVIGTVDITFSERTDGESKIHFLKAIWEIGWNALQLRCKGRPPLLISPDSEGSMLGAGVAHNQKRFITHTTLHHRYSALHTFAPWQRNFAVLILVASIVGFSLAPLLTGIVIIAVLSSIYFIDVFFNLGLVLKSLKTPPEIESTEEELRAIPDAELPIYSILCPLYKEAHMLPGFVAAIEKLHWPQDKLDVLLLLEENDPETIAAAEAQQLPPYVRVIVVPHSEPKTKPKACNYGLSIARGEYTVIYDAEDIPDPWQLRKAYLGFQKSGPEVKCLQAKLNYFNPEDNLLTRFFTAEYSLWFDIILVGLQSINTSIPLGGTSNHFRTRDLIEFEGWDPFNVTEDCDLGVRIFKRGARTAIIDSVTLEEANGHTRNWLRQRSRWIKGYMQTYLVHMRHPVTFLRENGIHALLFQLVVGAKLSFLFINPILWLTTIAYFTLYAYVGPTIEALYPTWIFYMAAISLVFGNFFYLYYYMVGCAKRHHWPLIKYVFFVPLYWILGSTAAYVALYELLVKPHYWQKTVHGLNLVHSKKREEKAERRQAMRDFVGRMSVGARGMVPDNIWNFIFSSKGLLMTALVGSSFINFIFNAFLGRALSFEQLSLVTLINTLWFLVMVVIGAFASTINFRTSYLVGAKAQSVALAFMKNSLEAALIIAGTLALFWVALIPFTRDFFRLSDPLALLLFAPVFLFAPMVAAYRGFLQGNFLFKFVAFLFFFEAAIKLVLAVVMVALDLEGLVYATIPASIVLTALVGYSFVRRAVRSIAPLDGHEADQESFPRPFFAASLVTNVSAVFFLSVDVILANHFLQPHDAGQYALLSLVGKMIYFFGAMPNVFTVSFVSRKEGLKQSSHRIFAMIYGLTLVFVGTGFLGLGLLGGYTVPLLFGEKALSIVSLLIPYTAALGLFTLSGVLVSYHLAKKQYQFSGLTFLLSLVLVAGMSIFHRNVEDFVWVTFFTSLSGWVLLWLLHFSYRTFPSLQRGIIDLFDIVFGRYPAATVADGKKRILIMNWRDSRHVYAGGAEVYVEEIAREWVKEGHHVTIFSGNDGKSPRHETINGVRIIRRGGFFLVYVWAFLYYILRLRGKYDVVVDCENGIPFFTPLYVRKSIVCLMHHVHQDVFFRLLPKPFAWFASFLEKNLMPLIYSNVSFVTVSDSSREEMQALGLGKAGITVVHPGVDREDFSRVLVPKSIYPTVLYLGRLKAYKSVNVLIQAFRIVLSERPEARLIIAGDGEEREHLKRLAHELRLSPDQVKFVGHIRHKEKVKLLQEAWMLVNPSFMEGWGIVAIEASAAGTPVIASDVPGLRDSVKHEGTGYLVEYGDVKGFAERIHLIIRDKELREGLAMNAREWAGNFSWSKSSEAFLRALMEKI